MTDRLAEPRALRIGSLCTGYGGLDMAAHAVFGGTLAWVSDIEPGPCQLLAARYPDVPNLGDLTAVDWAAVEPVDVLTAGYPCQPFSHAGQRKGEADERHLWPFISDAIGALRPGIVVLENVAGHLSLGGPAVVAGLTALRYDARWLVVRAADIGACHRRARLFIVARDTKRSRTDARPAASRPRGAIGESGGGPVAHADINGREVVERVESRVGPRHDADGLRPLLPTPVANDDHKTAEAHVAAKVRSGAGATVTSLDVMARQAADTGEWSNKLLPTPTSAAGSGGNLSRSGDRGDELLLPGLVKTFLPTPRASANENRQTKRSPSQEAGKHGLSLAAEVASLSDGDVVAAGLAHEDRSGLGGGVLAARARDTRAERELDGETVNEVLEHVTRSSIAGKSCQAKVAFGVYQAAIDRHARAAGRAAPAPTDAKNRLSAAFVEWMMMLPEGWVTDIITSRTAALKLLGNGVVPPQAEYALRQLVAA